MTDKNRTIVCAHSSEDPWFCVVHESAWDVNQKQCQKALGLSEPKMKKEVK